MFENFIKRIKYFYNSHIDTLPGRLGMIIVGFLGIISFILLSQPVRTFIEYINFFNFIKHTERINSTIYIFYISLPLIFILWLLRTHDKLRNSNENHYFNALNLLAKKDDPQALKLGLNIILELSKKGVFKKEIENTLSSMSFKNIQIKGLEIKNLTFNQCDFTSSNFKNAILNDVIFDNCIFTNARFEKTILENINFKYSHLHNAYFADAVLKEVDFSNIIDGKIDLSKFQNAKLFHVDFSSQKIDVSNFNDNYKILKNSYYNKDTSFFENNFPLKEDNNKREEKIKKIMIYKK